ncbi:PIG-L deacetylase family protein [Kineosporia sp. R_H_3]|uniref:PIG-L deacetylase family protein n=1 Tax=Kineosporia sp. R_H_3 TaxID=1961848 RepID=UPI000B4A7E0F|nr:PIG-L family deacetylase [Kineosporia sp. R_H_3]
MSDAQETRSPATTSGAAPPVGDDLPGWRRPLVVVAHPDDESFGLGAVLSAFVGGGACVAVLCFTHGEASTLHGVEGDLRELRAAELAEAAHRLGLATVELLDEPDGALGVAGTERLVTAVLRAVDRHAADGLVVFDDTGITGHPDHVAATAAAVTAARGAGLPVLAWTLPEPVAQALREEFGAPFAGRPPAEVDLVVGVDRATQLEAVAAHPSQAVPGSVLWRRLDLLGPVEHLRWLHRPA